MPSRDPHTPWPVSGTPALARAAENALALRTTRDLPSIVEVVGESVRASVGGVGWHFFSADPQSGALARWNGRPVPVSGTSEIYLPEPGGAVEWLLRHETPLFASAGDPDAPALETSLWAVAPRGLVGLPVASGQVLHGLLLIALDEGRVFGPEERLLPRLLADQLAVALDRHALAEEARDLSLRMTSIEGRAQAGEQLFSELISVVAHEIRTPLTSIKAYAETLLDAPDTEFEQRRDFLGVINDECDRLARLVSDALDLSRLEAGHRPLKVRPLGVGELLEDVVRTLGPDAERRTVSIAPAVEAGLGEVEADPDLLKQLLLNLVGNAVKFSPAGAAVRLTAMAQGEDWIVNVADSGSGIPDELLDRIFERFYRVELRGGRRVPGTGLGLAIARHIVELHGGRIWAENAPGGGSLFRVCLPRRQLAPASVRRVSAELVGRADVRALLDAAVEMVSEVMEARIVSIMLVDPDQGDLHVAAARGLDETALHRRTHYRGGVAGAAVIAGGPILVDNIETDRRFSKPSHPQYFTKSLLCAPLAVGGETVGVLNVNNKESHEEFDEDDLAVLTALVARLSGALSRAHAHPDVPAVVSEALETLRSLARAKREFLLGRREVARYARSVARRLALPESLASLVGYVALAPALEEPFADPGPDGHAGARAILLARGEHLDGSGYPNRLAGTAIPVGSRILAVLDEFEALTQGRPYRVALSLEDALVELRRGAGTRFDPTVVEALADVLGEEGRLSGRREVA